MNNLETSQNNDGIDTKSNSIKSSKSNIKKMIIKRVKLNSKKGTHRFIYLDGNNKHINDNKTLDRIKKLSIPPAYTDIKISNDENHYLQAVGIDDKGRKQYIYKDTFVSKQSKFKYCQLKHFGQHISEIRKNIRAIMLNDNPVMSKEKIIALVIYILDNCHFRIGNLIYYTKHKSHGVSTLQPKHFKKVGNSFEIEFIGKKGVLNKCILEDPVAVKLIKELISITNKENHPNNFIFHYKDEKDNLQLIKPIDINNFLIKYNPDITLKMFRTWGANFLFLEEMIKNKKEFVNIYKEYEPRIKELKKDKSSTSNDKLKKIDIINKKILKDNDKLIRDIIQNIAIKLHNTPTISKKSYLDNNLVLIYQEDPKSFWTKIIHSSNKNDLTNLLSEFLNYNCSVKKTTKKKQNGGSSCYFLTK